MKQLPIVDVNTDTFYSWVVKVNGIIDFANTEIVTANNSANGAITVGTGYVSGAFGSNTITCDTLRGGNTVSSGVLTITSNSVFTDNLVRIDKGLTLGANGISHDHSIRITTSNTSTQTVDSFSINSYRTAKYVISITDPVNSKYQATEIMLMHDGSSTYSTEYATLSSNSVLATFASDINTGNVRLLVTPATSNVQINVSRTLIST
jgi:hypothetical protein